MADFFAPSGKFAPCGMFTPPHVIATAISVVLVVICLVLFQKKITTELKTRCFRVLAILLTLLETTKITHSFVNGNTNIDAWMPISYCSLFIYAVWMAGFGKSYIKRAGEAFIAYGCPIAGAAFLIFPTTSLMNYPIWHFLSLYSMFFHTLMLFFGISSLISENKLNKKTYCSYCILLITFAIPAITLNITKSSNLMNLREPYNIPIQFLQDLYSGSQFGYTALVLFAYLLIPFIVGLMAGKIKKSG